MEEVRAIGEVAVVQEELHLLLVLVLVEVLDAARVERRAATNDAVDGVALVQ